MANRSKSLLMTYMRRKHRNESFGALFTLVLFSMLVAVLVAPTLTGMAPASPSVSMHFGESAGAYPSTGMFADQSPVFAVMWLLALVILVPIELALRKR